MKKNQGFTLIELLVVVLIIGILAAIALPMYTKTVEKSRMTEMITLTKSIADSMQRYQFEGGDTATGKTLVDALDIDLPGEWSNNNYNLSTKNFYYNFKCTKGTFCEVMATRGTTGDGGKYYYDFTVQVYESTEDVDKTGFAAEGWSGNTLRLMGYLLGDGQFAAAEGLCKGLKGTVAVHCFDH